MRRCTSSLPSEPKHHVYAVPDPDRVRGGGCDVKTKRTLSSLRFVMLEIESRVLASGAWVDKPIPADAAKMLDAAKESIGVRPPSKRGELQPVEQLQWTSLGRILRDQKKLWSKGEEEEEEEEEFEQA
ncbi:unnamed protein product [Phytophthora lilii]|uniref:Unnamed protein product n=1 Tax=Phytophthora lilii TaxID=2077276 RepID=A0A9W6WZ32_9STRA|nr:unnamed protein product [Phytophthora lilii]